MQKWIATRWQYIAGMIAAACLVVAFLWFSLLPFARWVTQSDVAHVGRPPTNEVTTDKQLEAIDAVRGRMLQLLGGTAVLGTLVLTLLSYRLSVRQHRGERYGRAVAQLGAARAFERTGGILELEEMMRQ